MDGYALDKLSDDEIGIMLNAIEQKKCRFGADIEKLTKEKEALLNELTRRGYTTKYINVDPDPSTQ